jgi:uncharacterized protein (UPF0332 family)
MIFGIAKTKNEKAEEELWFKAEMTHKQILALSHKLNNSDIENEIINLAFFKKIVPAKTIELNEIEKWLNNAWNTENILCSNYAIIDNSGQGFALQWAFPQAYYSIYGTLLAHFNAVGYTEKSHSSVLKKFGQLTQENRLPESICFRTNGAKKHLTYHGILKPENLRAIDLDIGNPETIDNQICQFFKSTRELKLAERAPDIVKNLKLRTSSGVYKKNLSSLDWQKVSSSIGITSILDMLYRKRIKANYQDIDVFTYEKLKGKDILENLCSVVNRINLVNETYVAKAIGLEKYNEIVNNHLKRTPNSALKKRHHIVSAIVIV